MRTLDPARSVWSKESGRLGERRSYWGQGSGQSRRELRSDTALGAWPSACQAEARLEASAGVEVLGVIDSMEAAPSVIVTPGAEQTSPPRA
jgi:hypothetical protein